MAEDQQQQSDQQQQQGNDQQQQQQHVAPEWIGGLSDEGLRSNEHLSRYKSVDDLAKAHVETVNWARGRAALPVPDANNPQAFEQARADFVAKARPESADKYTITLPEGQTDTTRADAFRAKAFDLGLMPWQVEALNAWDNNAIVDATSKLAQGNKDALKTREMNMGPAAFARGEEAIAAMFEGIEGIDATKVMQSLESATDAGVAYDFLYKMAERTGELEKVDGAAVDLRLGAMSPESAQQEISRLYGDAEFMAKAAQKGTREHQRWEQLNEMAAKSPNAA